MVFFFWANEDTCDACDELKNTSFKLFRTLEGQHTEGRTIHVNDNRYVEIYTTKESTHVDLGTSHCTQIGLISKLTDSRLSVQYFGSSTEVHVVQFASRQTNISLFGSSCTAGLPKHEVDPNGIITEVTEFDIRPSAHLGLTLGLLVACLIEHTTFRGV